MFFVPMENVVSK